jgi:hypothetical protein
VLKVCLPSYFWPLLGCFNAKPFLPPAPPLHKQANAFFPTLSLNCKFLKVSSKYHYIPEPFPSIIKFMISEIGSFQVLSAYHYSHMKVEMGFLCIYTLRVLWSEFAGSVYILRCYLIIGLFLREFSSIGFDFFWYFVFDYDRVFLDGDFGSYWIRILYFGSCLFYLYAWCACSV